MLSRSDIPIFILFYYVGTIYAPTFSAFLGVRSLFGIMMGGVFGGAAAMALENVPVEARGLLSGIFQQG